MTDKADERAYTIGRGKPPVHFQFKPGQSGNLRGRPKGRRNFLQDLIDAASETVVITENGRKARLSKQQVAVRQVVNKAASGDHRSIELLIKHLGIGPVDPAAVPPTQEADPNFGSEDDEQVLEDFLQRCKQEGTP